MLQYAKLHNIWILLHRSRLNRADVCRVSQHIGECSRMFGCCSLVFYNNQLLVIFAQNVIGITGNLIPDNAQEFPLFFARIGRSDLTKKLEKVGPFECDEKTFCKKSAIFNEKFEIRERISLHPDGSHENGAKECIL